MCVTRKADSSRENRVSFHPKLRADQDVSCVIVLGKYPFLGFEHIIWSLQSSSLKPKGHLNPACNIPTSCELGSSKMLQNPPSLGSISRLCHRVGACFLRPRGRCHRTGWESTRGAVKGSKSLWFNKWLRSAPEPPCGWGKNNSLGDLPVVLWLRLCTSPAGWHRFDSWSGS